MTLKTPCSFSEVLGIWALLHVPGVISRRTPACPPLCGEQARQMGVCGTHAKGDSLLGENFWEDLGLVDSSPAGNLGP